MPTITNTRADGQVSPVQFGPETNVKWLDDSQQRDEVLRYHRMAEKLWQDKVTKTDAETARSFSFAGLRLASFQLAEDDLASACCCGPLGQRPMPPVL